MQKTFTPIIITGTVEALLRCIVQGDVSHSASRPCNSKSTIQHVGMNLLNTRKEFFHERKAYHMLRRSFCDGYFCFPDIGSWKCDSSLGSCGAIAGRRVGMNWSTFQQFHLLKLCRACIAQVACPAVFNRIVLMLNWKNVIQSFGWFYRLVLQFFNGRNLYMLLDANTVTGSCDCGKCVQC